MKLIFHKMNGIGNDYIYIEGFTKKIETRDIVPQMLPYCRRHFGIGSDGIIFLLPSAKADAKMEMYNSDGSRAQMCGNGLRCCVRLFNILDIDKKDIISVETDDGIMEGTIDGEEVTIKMSRKPEVIQEEKKLTTVDKDFLYYEVNVGNPHAVISYGDGVRDFNVEKYGPSIENNTKLFPERVNSEFYEVIKEGHVFMRVWERGSGETYACGTGAVAVAGVYRIINNNQYDEVQVDLLGGSLFFKWDKDEFYMRGDTTYVFKGELEISL